MPVEKLEKIFEPKNVAVIGATDKEGSVGLSLMNNLSDRSQGKVYPINPNRDNVLEIETHSNVKEIPEPVDLGVIATPAPTVPDIVKECGEAGIPGLIIISAGFSETGSKGKKLEEEIAKIREEYGMRILGPNCLGVINPHQDLNATFTEQMPEKGGVTFISQSGALASSTLDWAIFAQFGFSSFVSVGNMVDINFGDLIDYFGRDPRTESILMYIEAIKNAPRFMSASRSFARTKPIMAVKSGRHKAGAKAVASHTGSLAGSDEVYDGAFKRVGITRVNTVGDLFACSETLAKQETPEGPNLTIVTNAGGPGAMAADAIIDWGGELASLSASTVQKLKDELPSPASLSNPVDVTGEANPEELKKSVDICLKDKNTDGILCIYTPLGTMGPSEAAEAIAGLKEKAKKPILGCWMGGEKIQKGRQILRRNGFSVQSAPEQTVRAYMYLNRYARNLERLLETPEELPVDRAPPKYNLKAMIRRIARNDRETLTERESKKILRTYGIPSPRIHIAENPDDATKYAARIGFPVVLKIHSHDITHKNRVGGVALNVTSKSEARKKFEEIIDKVKENRPSAELKGVTVQKMIQDKGVELILGSKKDPLFGTTLMFGRGGTDVEYYKDTAVGFPPLNQTLARYLTRETKVSKKLRESEEDSNFLPALEEHLVSLSQLVIDFPEIVELDINPLAETDDEFIALDALIKIDKDLALGKPEPNEHLVIEPYPRKYVEQWKLDDGKPVTLRPIRPEDEPLEFELFDTFSKESWRFRFFAPVKEVTHEDMVRFTNIDYRRETAIIGILEEGSKEKMIGVGRIITDPDGNSGEFAVIVGDPWQGLGLGEKLTDSIIGVADDKGLEEIWATIMKKNIAMINLCKKLGFETEEESEDTVKATLELR